MWLRNNGLLDGSLMYHFGGWFEVDPAACPMARSCITSSDGSDRDGPGVLPDGSLVALWRIIRIETGSVSCLTACSYIASVDGSD